jgi:hypothetical protein
MAGVSRESAAHHEAVEGFEGDYGEAGEYTIGFERYAMDMDGAPLFVGLPDDRCQAPHWGYVIRGKVGYRTAAGEETFEAGTAYYVGPGHTPVAYAGSEIVEFSPTGEYARTMEVVMRNAAAAD